MSEPTVDSGTRMAVLEALAAKQAPKEKGKISAGCASTEFDETTSFETLLEASLSKRDEVSEEDEKEKDEVRKRAINESQVDMIGDIMKRML